jgi:hypothetical protein
MATAAEVIAGEAAWGVDCSDALAGLRGLPDGCVQCCLTSPPFWNLRDYGTATWEGGSPDCDHKGAPKRTQAGFNERYFGRLAGDDKQGELREPYRAVCGKCGARRVDRQIGLEDTPDAYVARLVEVFREVRRVLHPSGLLLLNVGDSYSSGARRTQTDPGDSPLATLLGGPPGMAGAPVRPPPVAGVKEKDLLGIPWALAFALRADGWYLRCAPPLVKDNCMPESVRDRPTTAHEYWFLLAKGPRYFWDADAVRVPHETKPQRRLVSPRGEKAMSARGAADVGFARYTSAEPTTYGHPAGRNLRTSDVFYQGLDDLIEQQRAWLAHLEHVRAQGGMLLDREGDPLALCYPTFAFPGSHFATFSPHMITPLLKAATSERGCCPACRAPWVRQTERRPVPRIGHVEPCRMGQSSAGAKGNIGLPGGGAAPQVVTTGWQPSCACPPADAVPCLILDCFAGSGTVGLVARRLGRRFVGLDLNAAYCEMARKRIEEDSPLFNASLPSSDRPAPVKDLFSGLPEGDETETT